MPHVGQRCILRIASSDYRPAKITNVVSGDTVHMIVFSTYADWPDNSPAGVPSEVYNDVAKGTGVGEWQEDTGVDPAVQGAIDFAAADCLLVPAAGSSVSLALNTPRRPSTTRPVKVTVYGTWSWTLSAIGSQSGTATLQSDSSSTPTTTRGVAPCARGISVGVTVGDTGTMPWTMSYTVPVGHYYQIATSGTGTFAIAHIDEQAE